MWLQKGRCCDRPPSPEPVPEPVICVDDVEVVEPWKIIDFGIKPAVHLTDHQLKILRGEPVKNNQWGALDGTIIDDAMALIATGSSR